LCLTPLAPVAASHVAPKKKRANPHAATPGVRFRNLTHALSFLSASADTARLSTDMTPITRRHLLSNLSAAVAASAVEAQQDQPPAPANPLHVLVIGAHPGDPEAGCGGTIARYTKLGHQVTALYLTRGEAGVAGATAQHAAATRSAEAEEACKILGATAAFAGQIDAATEVNAARSADFTRQIQNLAPDVVFTQWPVDTHADHRACASLTITAWLALKRNFALYYYEVDLGSDTQCFAPAHYVDVTATEPLKRQACMCHRSQNPQGFYNRDHVPMMHFRGMESGYQLAEAFIHHAGSPLAKLP
jgi:LmbE family N-acetylglucosaminyl deacetylase